MALVSMRQLLDHAAENGYGVPAFNVNNLEQVQAIMEAAKNLNWEDPPLLLDGISVMTGEGDAFPIQQVQLQRWTGEGYERFGDVIDAADINE